jgi:nicotinic acid mononucleotide adenylyltransferase
MASIAAENKKYMADLTELFQQTRITGDEDYGERKRKVAVMNFGRLNPPTRGHYKLLEYIAEKAKLLGGKGFIFLSASQNYLPPHKGTKWRPVVNRVTKSTFRSNKSNENPLSVWDKMNILHKFPEIENLEYINPQGEKGRPYTMDRAADYLRNEGYTDIYLVVGTDRFEQLKDKGVESTWNLTLIEHPRSERLDDLTLYSIDKTIPKKSLAIKPEAISGTKSRAAAAEHAINGINGIDSMTLRQAEEAIMNRRNRMHQSHGFITFKEYMPNILTDSQLELIIYKIKKGMLLRPSQSYTNNHKRNRMVRRSSMTKTRKTGGKRRKKKTRKKKGKGAVQSYFSPAEPQRDYTWDIANFDNDGNAFEAAGNILNLFMRDDDFRGTQEEAHHRSVYQTSLIDDYHSREQTTNWEDALRWLNLENFRQAHQAYEQQRPQQPQHRRRRQQPFRRFSRSHMRRSVGGVKRHKKKTRKMRGGVHEFQPNQWIGRPSNFQMPDFQIITINRQGSNGQTAPDYMNIMLPNGGVVEGIDCDIMWNNGFRPIKDMNLRPGETRRKGAGHKRRKTRKKSKRRK